jgi:type II secretory pathway component PulM
MKSKLALWWNACSSRERRLLVAWSLAAVALLLWFAVVSPLGRRIDQLEKRVPELETRLNAMRSQALSDLPAQGRASAASSKTAADLRSTLFRAIGERKISAELRALSSSRVEMRLPELAMNDALDLLEHLRSESGARIVVLNASAPAGAAARLVVEFERAP